MRNLSSSSSSSGSVGASSSIAPARALAASATQAPPAPVALELPPPPRRPSDPDLLRLQQLEIAADDEIPPPPQEPPPEAVDAVLQHGLRTARKLERRLHQDIVAGLLPRGDALWERTKAVIVAYHKYYKANRFDLTPAEALAIMNKCVCLAEQSGVDKSELMAEISLSAFELYAREATGLQYTAYNSISPGLVMLTGFQRAQQPDALAAVRATAMLGLAQKWGPELELRESSQFTKRCAAVSIAQVDVGLLTQAERDRIGAQTDWIVNRPLMGQVRQAVIAWSVQAEIARDYRMAAQWPTVAEYADDTATAQPTPVVELKRYAAAMEQLLDSEFRSLARRRVSDGDADRKFRDRTETTINTIVEIWRATREQLSAQEQLRLLNKCVDLHERCGAGRSLLMREMCLHAFCLYVRQAIGMDIALDARDGWLIDRGSDSNATSISPTHKADPAASVRAVLMLNLARDWSPPRADTFLEYSSCCNKALKAIGAQLACNAQIDFAAFTQGERGRLLGRAEWRYADEKIIAGIRESAHDWSVQQQLAIHGGLAPLSETIATYANENRPPQSTPLHELERYATEMEQLLEGEFRTLADRRKLDTLADQKLLDRTDTTIQAIFDLLQASGSKLSLAQRLKLLNRCVDLHERSGENRKSRLIARICMRAFGEYAQQATGLRMRTDDESSGAESGGSSQTTHMAEPVAAARAAIMLGLAAQWAPYQLDGVDLTSKGNLNGHRVARFEDLCAHLSGREVERCAFTPREVSRLLQQGNWLVNGRFMAVLRDGIRDKATQEELGAHSQFAGVAATIAYYADENRPKQPTPAAELKRYAIEMERLLESEFHTLAQRREADPQADRKFQDRTETTVQALLSGTHPRDSALHILHKCMALYQRAFGRPGSASRGLFARAFDLHCDRAGISVTDFLRAGLLLPLLQESPLFPPRSQSWKKLTAPPTSAAQAIDFTALTPVETRRLFDDSAVACFDRAFIEAARQAARAAGQVAVKH